jgi:hypothetical protein
VAGAWLTFRGFLALTKRQPSGIEKTTQNRLTSIFIMTVDILDFLDILVFATTIEGSIETPGSPG